MPREPARRAGAQRRGGGASARGQAGSRRPSTLVSVRLPNSMSAVVAELGVRDVGVSVQRGQVGQPSPEPVRRTAPPVTTMPTLTTTGGHGRAPEQAIP